MIQPVLSRICGLRVRRDLRRGVQYFTFRDASRCEIKSVCTYRKARVFAEGYAERVARLLKEDRASEIRDRALERKKGAL